MNAIDLIGKRVPVLDGEGFVELQDIMPHPATGVAPDRAIVNAARVSYLGSSKGDEQDKKLLIYLMENKHTTPFEMVEFKFRVKAPIFVLRQWMRHRTASYNEVSRRYTSESIQFYRPQFWRNQSSDNKQGSTSVFTDYALVAEDLQDNPYLGNVALHSYDMTDLLTKFNDMGLSIYNAAIDNGVANEMARMFLPVNLYSEMIVKVDAHNLMHFLKLRMHEHAQWEIREYATAIFHEFFRPLMPWTAEGFCEFYVERSIMRRANK